jgi:DNA-binding SARP family transcriptional activator
VPHLHLILLGAFQATLDGQPVVGFESNKVRALLAYLAMEANRPHPRATLAGLLWPERSDCDALANLRYALSNLRQAIGDRSTDPPFLLITHDTLQLNPHSDHHLDVAAFEALIGQGDPSALQAAVSLCQGDFLEGFGLSDSAPFEEWLTLKREQVSRRMFRALRLLAEHFERQGDYEQARHYAQRQVEREQWQEEAHQQLMRVLALGGHRAAALAQFETCRRVLAEELDVSPARETVLLYEAIRDDKLIAPHLAALLAARPGS